MRRPLLAALVFLAPALAAPAALAQNSAFEGVGLAPVPSQSIDLAPSEPLPVVRQVDDRVAFNTTEQWLIPYYFRQVRDRQKRAARNKRYERALPAGLTQNPAKGDRLSGAVLAELPRLPGPLLRELPPARPGTDRLIAGKNVLMVSADGQVLDVLSDIIH